ncbi:Oidioi.mRNA.OKI2018_I69.PAR.g8843.t1.cds [Oikopleura dioica]|uniref:Oidioi.mRNA.OKI2018_I69.PAR.g8843.t1.cds n=1 Tax=Oikopleura dioica TaxID=34765 RepID=A0ABN7RHW1_OIKDI|nr:Oidioi.mRNA.OKI2018_I69.PAR.g8843.t1.cds [Oikopleura dioica]
MLITVSDRPQNHIHEFMIDALLGQFQCLEIEQRFDVETGKFQKNFFFNGNIIKSWTLRQGDVFTGPLQVFISDKWHHTAELFSVVNFIYESL